MKIPIPAKGLARSAASRVGPLETLLTAYLRRVNRAAMQFETTAEISLPAPRPGRLYLLYIHIPFCEVLCPFCSFHRVKLNRSMTTRYFVALRQELRIYHALGYRFGDVYVGGGTPTVVTEELVETIELARSLFPIQRVAVETNPNDLRDETLEALRGVGVNRLSVGVQSFDNGLLKAMDRYDKYGSRESIIEHLHNARGYLETVNVDMIFNLPGQSQASLEQDIRILTEDLAVDQVSFYPLMSSSSAEKAMAKQMGAVSYGHEKPYYNTILEGMERAAYSATSAWCFSRTESMIDEYIVDHGDYAAVGSGAFSYIDGVTYSSTFSVNRYVERVQKTGRPAITAMRAFSPREQMRYDLLMNLFGLTLDREAMEEKHHGRFERTLRVELALLKLSGAIDSDATGYRLTRPGMYYWVVMMREFFIGVNNFRDQMRARVKEERDEDAPLRLHPEVRTDIPVEE